MPTLINKLDAISVKHAIKPGYYADGGGLYLQVGRRGAKSWVFRFTMNGRTREMGLGPLADVTLAEARLAARGARSLKSKGIDPIEAKRAEAAAAAAATTHQPTFKEEAEAFIEAHAAGWKNAKHAQQWRNTLATYAYPDIGKVPVRDVDTAMLVRILEPIWREIPETANRVRGRIEQILNRAATRGHRTGENPARWRGHFANILPARAKIAPVEHHPALPYGSIGDFMTALRQRSGTAARALELTILTAARSDMTFGARWKEFDLEAKIWSIPKHRMKRSRDFRIPLSERAIAVLGELEQRDDDDFVFPGQDPMQHINENAMLDVISKLGFDKIATTHGFRSTFKDWALEQTGFPPELSEVALSHVVKDKTEAAYRRGDLFDKRRRLMHAWAQFCSKPSAKGADVAPTQRGRKRA